MAADTTHTPPPIVSSPVSITGNLLVNIRTILTDIALELEQTAAPTVSTPPLPTRPVEESPPVDPQTASLQAIFPDFDPTVLYVRSN